jgi:hypothetical protein
MYGYNLGLAKAKVSESIPAAPANVVLPSLVGNGAVGSVVTCNPGAWSGSPSPTFTFNFKLDTVSVQSGASNTYTPLIGDDTKTLTCTVTATNTEGSANADTSNSLVIGTAPANTVAPVISGTNTFGSTLTTTNGTFTGTTPLTYTYQWLRGGSPITGETASTYVIGASDSLAAITCEVKATNSYGFDSEVSNTITVQDFAPINTVAPTVSPSGTQSTGTLITANVGTWTGVVPITYEYKWTRNGVAISGATASTYTIQLADDGTTIRVEVKGTNAYGVSAFIASSNSVSAVNSVAPTNTVAPVISGTAVVGQVLTSTTGTWSGIPTPTYSYQWKRGATNIGTNSSTYTLVQADAGNTSNITCVVTATNAGGSANATSNQIAQILTVRTSAFLTASAISDATIRNGLNTFDVGIISNSLDTKMKALYPFVGGTASTHKFNFMNSADTNAAFRLVFSGTWTHSTTGALPNGTNAFADTFLVGSAEFNTTTFNHLSYYSRSNTAKAAEYVMGSTDGGGNHGMIIRRDTGLALLVSDYPNSTSFRTASATVTDSRGLFLGSQTGTNAKLYKNGIVIGSNSSATVNAAQSTRSLYIGALSQPVTASYTDKQCAFASIGQGLTDAESANLYTLVQALQTTLGRNV